jgi:hypothetical protein
MEMTKHALSRLQQRIACVAPSKNYDRSDFMYDMKAGEMVRAQETKQKRWKMEVRVSLCSWRRNPRKVKIILILCPRMKTIITLWISSLR